MTVLLPANIVVAFAYTLAPTLICIVLTVEMPTLRSIADRFAVAVEFATCNSADVCDALTVLLPTNIAVVLTIALLPIDNCPIARFDDTVLLASEYAVDVATELTVLLPINIAVVLTIALAPIDN